MVEGVQVRPNYSWSSGHQCWDLDWHKPGMQLKGHGMSQNRSLWSGRCAYPLSQPPLQSPQTVRSIDAMNRSQSPRLALPQKLWCTSCPRMDPDPKPMRPPCASSFLEFEYLSSPRNLAKPSRLGMEKGMRMK